MKKSKVKKHLDITEEEAIANNYYRPRKSGESLSVEYEIDGLTKSYCKVTEWSNGEGYDISFDTEKQQTKKIDLHTDEIDVFLACLNHFRYFG